MTTKIIGTGSYLPPKKVTNDDLAKLVDTNDEWIVTRTGIRERRVAKEESFVDLAVKAGERAIENAGIQAEEIDLILVATMSSGYALPSISSVVQAKLKVTNAIGIDMNVACSGFVFGLATANAYIQSGIYRTVLVIGAEVLSNIVNWNDRGTCILFGDGAGAVIARASETGRMEQLLFTDGSKGDCLTTVEEMTSKGNMQSFIEMNGQEVFRFAVKKVPECIELLLQKSQIEKDNIAYYFLHQANARIIKSVSERLHIPIEKFPTNLESYGNTSSASVPILLDEANKKGLLHNGDYIVMAGFGGGLSWGSILLRW